MNSQVRARWRLRAALLGAVVLFSVVWAGFLAVLVRRAGAGDGGPAALAARVPRPSPGPGLIGAAAAAPPPLEVASGPPRARAVRVEHDDMPSPGSVRHLVRAIVPKDLAADELRRLLDETIDAERLDHPSVDVVGAYLYEPEVYARFTGRVTALEAAVAHAIWAPGGDWQGVARATSHLDGRTVHTLPAR